MLLLANGAFHYLSSTLTGSYYYLGVNCIFVIMMVLHLVIEDLSEIINAKAVNLNLTQSATTITSVDIGSMSR